MSERIRSMQLGVDKVLALEARVAELKAENAKLRKCVKAGDNYIDSIYSITSNTGLLQAEWNEKIDYYAARAEVDK